MGKEALTAREQEASNPERELDSHSKCPSRPALYSTYPSAALTMISADAKADVFGTVRVQVSETTAHRRRSNLVEMLSQSLQLSPVGRWWLLPVVACALFFPSSRLSEALPLIPCRPPSVACP